MDAGSLCARPRASCHATYSHFCLPLSKPALGDREPGQGFRSSMERGGQESREAGEFWIVGGPHSSVHSASPRAHACAYTHTYSEPQDSAGFLEKNHSHRCFCQKGSHNSDSKPAGATVSISKIPLEAARSPCCLRGTVTGLLSHLVDPCSHPLKKNYPFLPVAPQGRAHK